MSTKYSFNRTAYFIKEKPKLTAIFIISIIVDLILVWNLTMGVPDNIVNHGGSAIIWKSANGFLLVINTLLLKIWIIYHFFRDLAKLKTGYVEINSDDVLHCVVNKEIPLNRAKMELGYVLDQSKSKFSYILSYRINRVDKLIKTRTGTLIIDGKIEMECLDDIIGLEMGIDDKMVTQITHHIIPAYYQGMDIIQLKLEEMILKK